MKIVILSRSAKLDSTRRLIDAARARDHQIKAVNPSELEMHLDGKTAGLFYKGKSLPMPDLVIPRIASSLSSYGLAVVEQFHMRGVVAFNDAQAMGQSRNPMRCLQRLSAHGVDIPQTVMARSAGDLKQMLSLVGGVPVMVKVQKGPDRHSAMVCETRQSLEAALDAVVGLGQDLIIQQYVRDVASDVRVFVVGQRAIAAAHRSHTSGKRKRSAKEKALTATVLTDAQRKAAETAAKVMGLELCTIDMLDVGGLPKVFEVNAVPALGDMEEATHVNIALAIVERAEALYGRQKVRAQSSQQGATP